MARPADDDHDDKPLDPAVEKVRRKLVRFVAINLGLLFVALMAVVGAIVYKTRSEAPPPAAPMTDIPTPAPGAMMEGSIPIPAGGRMVAHSISGNRLSLDVAMPDGSHSIHVYDMAERRMIGRFAVTSP